MTPERYHELELEALRCYDRLRRHAPRDAEIVYVVSRSVMRYMQNMEHNAGFEVRNGDGIVANFRGVRMFVAPPEIADDLLRPAVCGHRFFTGMEVGDLVIGADDRIYVIERVEVGAGGEPRAYLTELEYAIREARANEAVLNAPWRTEYMAIPYDGRPNRNGRMYASDFFANGMAFVPSAYEIAGNLFGDTDEEIRRIIEQSIRDSLQTAQPVRKKNEDELSAGDTKLLDEYLHSFMRPGA